MDKVLEKFVIMTCDNMYSRLGKAIKLQQKIEKKGVELNKNNINYSRSLSTKERSNKPTSSFSTMTRDRCFNSFRSVFLYRKYRGWKVDHQVLDIIIQHIN